jgi:hypothetical protein
MLTLTSIKLDWGYCLVPTWLWTFYGRDTFCLFSLWGPRSDRMIFNLEAWKCCQALRRSHLPSGEGSPLPYFASVNWHLHKKWEKTRKITVTITEVCSADQNRMRIVQSSWSSRAMVSSGLLAPAALSSRVRRRGQPSFSVSNCRMAVTGFLNVN